MSEKKNDIIYGKIMSIYNASEMEFIKSILEENNIKHYMQGRLCYNVSSLYEPEPVKLLVDKTQLQLAKDILENLNLKNANFTEECLQYLYRNICPKCKNEISNNTDNCSYCKTELYECDNCQALLLERDTICPRCKENLE